MTIGEKIKVLHLDIIIRTHFDNVWRPEWISEISKNPEYLLDTTVLEDEKLPFF